MADYSNISWAAGQCHSGTNVTNSQCCLLVVDKYWIFENFFDMPVGLLCARIVDCIDKQVVIVLM